MIDKGVEDAPMSDADRKVEHDTRRQFIARLTKVAVVVPIVAIVSLQAPKAQAY